MATVNRLIEWQVGNKGIDICIMHTLHVLLLFPNIPWRILNRVTPLCAAMPCYICISY